MTVLSHVTRLLLASLLMLCSAAVSAGEGKARLDRFLAGLDTMEAGFIQSLLDANDKLLEESSGVLHLARPGRFRLEYKKPYEQLYVADGEKIWMYDRDLEQITVKRQGEALGTTPAMLLSGSEPVEDNFDIEELGEHEGFYWLKLKPKSKDASFAYLRLAMEPGVLRAMEMVDSFGQLTRLYFTRVIRNPPLADDAFVFEPPPGVDVIGDVE